MRRHPSQTEFVALLAFVFATVAFSIDAMLPALPRIAAELSPAAINRGQLVLTAFMAGMGAGTLLAGPISDSIGRKPAILGGFALYAAGAVAAVFAPSLELLIAARVLQGLGAAGPRIVGMAMVRDLYAGREMARIMSFVNMLFILVPAAAPSIGAAIIAAFGWRGVFAAFLVFAVIGASWLQLRQPETLAPDARRPLSPRGLMAAARQVLSDRDVWLCTLTIGLGFGQMFALLSTAPQLWAAFGRADSFPLWFAAMALISASGTILNARLVMRVGMRRLASRAYAAQVVVAAAVLAVWTLLPQAAHFGLFFAWACSLFTMAGITFGNLNGIAMQRMGAVAGMAASLISSLSTLVAVLIAAPVGLAFDGTPVPVFAAALICSATAWGLMRLLRSAG